MNEYSWDYKNRGAATGVVEGGMAKVTGVGIGLGRSKREDTGVCRIQENGVGGRWGDAGKLEKPPCTVDGILSCVTLFSFSRLTGKAVITGIFRPPVSKSNPNECFSITNKWKILRKTYYHLSLSS